MIRYSDELFDEIRNSNDIVDIISQYVVLKRSGRNFFGLCPFHKEKSPSFSVSPDEQIFHCFGCGAGGNVFHFISEIENDIYSNKRMLRLLQGDVGSGKTIVAFLTMLPYVENKKQSVLMVPTSVLANQHYEKIKKLCENQNINVGLLTRHINWNPCSISRKS